MASIVRARPGRLKTDSETRTALARMIVVLGIVGVIVISALAIVAAKDREAMSRLVFTAVLPLFGTWVGTVLAFYFAHENFEAATGSALMLQGRELAAPVTGVMIPAADINAWDLKPFQDPGEVALADLRTKMTGENPPSRRLPIRTSEGVVMYVLHDSTLTAFTETAGSGQLFSDLLKVDKYRGYVEAVGYVSVKATIADARRELAAVKDCNDVFVTETGKREEPAVGWLTNTLLAGVQ